MLFHRLIRSAWITLIFIFPITAISADIVHVDASAPPGGNGTTWALAFDDLQDALDAASANDEVRVADGVYLPTKRVDPLDPRSASFEMLADVTLQGGYAGFGHPDPDERDLEAFPTILSGDLNGDDGAEFLNRTENCYHVVFNNENGLTFTAVLDGFTISGGNADEPFTFNVGGGMFLQSSSPTLIRCTFTDNGGSHGAGFFIGASSPVLDDCTFIGNHAAGFGGGILTGEAEPTLTRCLFTRNAANIGAGISFSETPAVLTDCLFQDNSAKDGGGMHNLLSSPIMTHCTFSGNTGGGMLNDLDSEPQLTDCLFSGNTSPIDGGGMANLNSEPVMTNCAFIGNSTQESGGAVFNVQASPTFMNCVFMNNSAGEFGGGIFNYILSSPVVTNCTFHGNSAVEHGGGVYNYQSDPVLTNSIFWASIPDAIYNSSLSSPAVTYCDVQGGYPGEGNIAADPLFVDSNRGDFHLQYTSPCRNEGNGEILTLPEKDFEGDPRIAQIFVDIGADEFHTHLYCTGDFTPGGQIEGKLVGLPGTSPVGLFLGSGQLDPPMHTMWGDFHLLAPWILVHLIPIPANGVLALPATVPAGPSTPYELYLQALIGLEPDSMSNLYVLEIR